MSLARTALRLAVVNALQADPVIAAACPDRVFDSEIGVYVPKPVPLIVVYTEDDGGDAWSANNGGPPFNEICDVTFEITVCSVTAVAGDDVDIYVPATTRELEAALDILEHRAVEAATLGDSAQSALVRKVLRRASRLRSVRYASEDTGARLARRLVTLTAELKGSSYGNPLDAASGPFAVLPEPLRSVAAGLDPGSSAYAACQGVAAKLAGTQPLVTPFAGAAATYAPQNLASDTPPDPSDAANPTFAQDIDLS